MFNFYKSLFLYMYISNISKVTRNFLCYFVVLFYIVAFMKTDNLSASNDTQQFVSGTVTDNGGNPLPGVTVIVKGTQNAVQTDFDGNYRIKASNGEVLIFSYVGMNSKEVPVTKTTIDVVLKEETSSLDEVVVTALGIKKRSESTWTLSYTSKRR